MASPEPNPTQNSTGKTFWDIIGRVFTGKPMVAWGTLIGIVLCFSFLIGIGVLRAEIKDNKFSLSFAGKQSSELEQSAKPAQELRQIPRDSLSIFCIEKGMELKKKYALRSVIQSYDFDFVNNKKEIMIVKERIMYDLIALEDISKQENIFKEEYSSNVAFKVERWYGNHEEKVVHMGNESAYYVHFNCKKGKTTTLVTGADFFYKYPLSNGRPSPFRDYTLGSNEDLWIYPNDEDVIGRLTMIVSSDKMKFVPVVNGALHTIGGRINDDDDYYYNYKEEFNSNNSVSSTWEKIKPGEHFALKIKWR